MLPLGEGQEPGLQRVLKRIIWNEEEQWPNFVL